MVKKFKLNPDGLTTWEEYLTFAETMEVTAAKYTKPIRIYCDVDGVVMPVIKTFEELDRLDGSNEITIYDIKRGYYTYYPDAPPVMTGLFVYNKFVAEKLAEWSKRDDVDFVWLTAWKHNAPYAIDEALGIKSVGFLQWQVNGSDLYPHIGKGWSISDDQKASPSKFVWIDDFANVSTYLGDDVPYFSRIKRNRETFEKSIVHEIDPSSYLNLTTNGSLGLTEKEINQVDMWLQAQ